MKAENWNKRTKRKEIQFSDEEYIAVEQKASAARIPVAAYIRQAALDKTLSAALSIEELEIMKRISAISYKMQVNLNSLQSWPTHAVCHLSLMLSGNISSVQMNISELVCGVKWI